MFFDRFCIFATSLCILPACAGVNPRRVFRNKHRQHSPRMCGGQPLLPIVEFARSQFSPHARGSTLCRTFIGVPSKIHPACAGVNPSASNQGHCGRNSPPHARGSTLPDCKSPQQNAIHPACAGVNPRSWRRLTARKNSPRTRGGQP